MFLIKHIPSWVWFKERKYLTKGEQRSICHKELIKYGIKSGYSMAAFFSKVQLVQDVHRPRVATLLKKGRFILALLVVELCLCKLDIILLLTSLALSWRRPLYIETSPLIGKANQRTGFCMITASVMKELTELFMLY